MNPIRILAVEDDPNDRHVLKHTFAQTGEAVEVEVFADGESAQERLRGCIDGTAAVPDVVMLDLQLPRMNGLDLLRWMKQTPTLRDVPVVILSGIAHPTEIDTAHELDVNIYLAKGDDIAEWERMAKAIIAFVQAYREELVIQATV